MVHKDVTPVSPFGQMASAPLLSLNPSFVWYKDTTPTPLFCLIVEIKQKRHMERIFIGQFSQKSPTISA